MTIFTTPSTIHLLKSIQKSIQNVKKDRSKNDSKDVWLGVKAMQDVSVEIIQTYIDALKEEQKVLKGKKVIEEQSDIDDDEGTYGSAQV